MSRGRLQLRRTLHDSRRSVASSALRLDGLLPPRKGAPCSMLRARDGPRDSGVHAGSVPRAPLRSRPSRARHDRCRVSRAEILVSRPSRARSFGRGRRRVRVGRRAIFVGRRAIGIGRGAIGVERIMRWRSWIVVRELGATFVWLLTVEAFLVHIEDYRYREGLRCCPEQFPKVR
jgi:hypothetical protein